MAGAEPWPFCQASRPTADLVVIPNEMAADANGDWAVIRVDKLDLRSDRYMPVEMATPGWWAVDTKVTALGHAGRLPMKLSEAKIKFAQGDYIGANLDELGGGSGGPLFGTDSGIVRGIMHANASSGRDTQNKAVQLLAWSQQADGSFCNDQLAVCKDPDEAGSTGLTCPHTSATATPQLFRSRRTSDGAWPPKALSGRESLRAFAGLTLAVQFDFELDNDQDSLQFTYSQHGLLVTATLDGKPRECSTSNLPGPLCKNLYYVGYLPFTTGVTYEPGQMVDASNIVAGYFTRPVPTAAASAYAPDMMTVIDGSSVMAFGTEVQTAGQNLKAAQPSLGVGNVTDLNPASQPSAQMFLTLRKGTVALNATDYVALEVVRVNGDNYDDLLAIRPSGAYDLYCGGASGLALCNTANLAFAAADSTVDSRVDAFSLFRPTNVTSEVHFRQRFSECVPDLIVGACAAPSSAILTGLPSTRITGSPAAIAPGNFNGDQRTRTWPVQPQPKGGLTDVALMAAGYIVPCYANENGVELCNTSIYNSSTVPPTAVVARDANRDGYDDLEATFQDGSSKIFWGKSTGLTSSNTSATTVVTNGDSLGTPKTGSGILLAPDWVLVEGSLVDSPRTEPQFVSVSWDGGATTQTRTALAVYPSGLGVSLMRLTSAFTGATTSALPAGSVQTWAQGILSSCSAQVMGNEFCSPTCPCTHGGPDCDSDAECSTGNVCVDNNGPGFGYGAEWDICVATECASLTPGSGTYCSAACPCGPGGGDCDAEGTDTQCQEGLVCDTNVGPAFKMGPDTDVCVPTACASVTMGTASYCTPGCPCGHGGGDCDATADCMPGLECGTDLGPAFKMSVTSDVCVPSACAAVALNTGTFCTPECPCGHGGGDCDADEDCLPGLVCGTDLGPAFAMGATYDVCVPSACSTGLYSSTFCSSACPCGHGGGNCDSDAECMPGLKCGTNNGATFGRPSTADICYRP
jgi:hypothetical protein